MTRRTKRAAAANKGERWYQSNLALSLISGLLLWAAFPPVGLAPLAWIAPLGWLVLVRRASLPGRRPYRAIWLGSALHWLAMLVGITFAHPLNLLGWLALCFYLAFYVPLFVGLTRAAVHKLRVPLILAAPIVWTGLELLRGHLFTGFSLALLGHSQFEWTALIQLSDFLGAYGVSFLVMFVAACLTSGLPLTDGVNHGRRSRRRLWPVLWAAPAIVAALAYGNYAGGRSLSDGTLKVALIQKSFNTRFELDLNRNLEIFREYRDLTLATCEKHPDLDMIVWPESVFTANSPELIVQDPQPGDDPSKAEKMAEYSELFRARVQDAAQGLNRVWSETSPQSSQIFLLVGTETYIEGRNPRQHNTALLITPCGDIRNRYYKMHPVMFGEYIPLANLFPWIYRLTPLPRGLTPGERPFCFDVKGVRMTPSICFESTVPHLIRRQVARLEREGTPPDVLVNISHDGWFWGSSILDFQLACAVFRSIELRKPFLVAANAGISAWIDEDGRIRKRGPRQGEAAIIASVGATSRSSWYTSYGDIPAGICLLACVGLTLFVCLRFMNTVREHGAKD